VASSGRIYTSIQITGLFPFQQTERLRRTSLLGSFALGKFAFKVRLASMLSLPASLLFCNNLSSTLVIYYVKCMPLQPKQRHIQMKFRGSARLF